MLANVDIMLTGHQHMLTDPWDRDWDPWGTLTTHRENLAKPLHSLAILAVAVHRA